MLYFPNAKINLGLYITEKRNDGYHNIETVFFPIQLSDVLEVLPQPEFSFKLTGLKIEGDPSNNLCVKAYEQLKEEFNLPPVYIQLHKIIPMGAGLGGGSADAAVVLKALNKQFNLGLTNDKLKQHAAKLGSDCAFFIDNAPSIATGRGEILRPVDVNLKGWHLVLVKPDIHVSTPEAYGGITPKQPQKPLLQVIQQPVETWRNELVNDFETTVFERYPRIGEIKQALYDKGAGYAAMSGSGSTVFALFKNEIDLKTDFPDCFVYAEMVS